MFSGRGASIKARRESIGIAIKVFDKETNVTSNYTSIKRAAKATGVSDFTLRYHFVFFFVLHIVTAWRGKPRHLETKGNKNKNEKQLLLFKRSLSDRKSQKF